MKLTYTVFTKKHLFRCWSFRNDLWQLNEMYFQTHVNCENYQNQFPIEWMASGVKNVYTAVWSANKTLLEVQAYHVKSIPNPLFLKYIILLFLYLGSSEKDEQSKFKTFQWWNYTKNHDEDQAELSCTVVQLSCGLFYKLLFHLIIFAWFLLTLVIRTSFTTRFVSHPRWLLHKDCAYIGHLTLLTSLTYF